MDPIASFLARDSIAQEAIFFSTQKSQSAAIAKFKEMDKAIATWMDEAQNDLNIVTGYLGAVMKGDNTEDAQKAIYDQWYPKWQDTEEKIRRNKEWDEFFSKNAGHRILQMADLKQDAVKQAEIEVVKKCQIGGDYRVRADKLVDAYGRLAAKISQCGDKCKGEEARLKSIETVATMYNISAKNLSKTIRIDMNNSILRLGKRKPFPISGADQSKP